MKYLFLTLLIITNLVAKEQSESFMVTMWDRSVKVVSPEKIYRFTSVIVENKTLNNIKAKLVDGEDVLAFITIPVGETRSVEVRYKEKGQLALIPISPPFQEVYLKVGSKSYEIPPRLER